jgi:hypothetical protein
MLNPANAPDQVIRAAHQVRAGDALETMQFKQAASEMSDSRSIIQHGAAQVFVADDLFNRDIYCVGADPAT